MDVLETFLAAGVSLGDALHVIDVLIGCHVCRSWWESDRLKGVIQGAKPGGNPLGAQAIIFELRQEGAVAQLSRSTTVW